MAQENQATTELYATFSSIIRRLLAFEAYKPLVKNLDRDPTEDTAVAQALNAAFLILLAGEGHPAYKPAEGLLNAYTNNAQWADAAGFYLRAPARIRAELEQQGATFASQLLTLHDELAALDDAAPLKEIAERLWQVFFPEGAGIYGQVEERVAELRDRRTVTITELNPDPITDPARQLLFTSNILLTLPSKSTPIDDLPYSEDLKEQLRLTAKEKQLYWFDHPIQIGVAPEGNEVLYGLRGLDDMVAYEVAQGSVPADTRLTAALSVSVTHAGLRSIAHDYLQEEFNRTPDFNHLDIYIFTEQDTDRLINEVLEPAAAQYVHDANVEALRAVFGVDGRYGRHYTFLKAISAVWHVLVDDGVVGTFKIDLDQVFPQKELDEQAGETALQHFTTPLWGATGTDSMGKPVTLGLIAGALVNERDIGRGLFTPDVTLPDGPATVDEAVFFSKLTQAVSTEAEMMTRYDGDDLDGESKALQRIHVTGGTNGILVDALRRFRTFTPTFVGRAEDQAYILSAFEDGSSELVYAHKPGLIMRHDKEAFAQEAMKAAKVGKLIGDYERMLLFSAYAEHVTGDISAVKAVADPFTGCFISHLPFTVAVLRFGLRAGAYFLEGAAPQGLELVETGAPRIEEAYTFVAGGSSASNGHGSGHSELSERVTIEREGWRTFYDILDALEGALRANDETALTLQKKAKAVVEAASFHE